MKVKNSNLGIEELLLGAIVLVPHILIALSPVNSLLRWYYTDDAFYYFVTARNISHGLGVTFDGINLTNGFHPLWMILLVPVFALARIDPILPLRLVIIVQAILSVVTGILMHRLCRKVLPKEISIIVAFLWVMFPQIYQIVTMGGMEAQLNATSITLFWVYLTVLLTRSEKDVSRNQITILGFLAAITILSRLDNVFLILVSGLWLLLLKWKSPEGSGNEGFEAWRRRFGIGVRYSLPILLLIGSYAILNKVGFDSTIPVSGQVKLWWGTLGERPYGTPPATLQDFYIETFTSENTDISPWSLGYAQTQSIVRSINDALSTIGLPPIARTIWLLILFALLLLADRKYAYKATVRLALPPLLIGCLMQIIYYKGTGHVAQRSWYWVTEIFFTVLFLGLLMAVAYRLVQRLRNGQSLGRVISLGVLLAISVGYVMNLFGTVTLGAVPTHPYLRQTEWLEAHTEPGTLIGMPNAGAVGYFIKDRTIVNIDGLINSMDYFRHLQTGRGAEFLTSIGLDFVFGRANLEDTSPYRTMFEEKLEPLASYINISTEVILWRFLP